MKHSKLCEHGQSKTGCNFCAEMLEEFGSMFENLPDLNTRTKKTDGGVQVEGVQAPEWELPPLKKMWCECIAGLETFGCYPEDGECICGTHKHHVHCGTCGKISQIG